MQVCPFGPLQNIPLQHSPGDSGPAEAPGTPWPQSGPVEENSCPCLLAAHSIPQQSTAQGDAEDRGSSWAIRAPAAGCHRGGDTQ